MTTLRFEGAIEFGDSYRVDPDYLNGCVHVGGRDVVAAVSEAKFKGLVTVGVADSSFTGDLFVETGWGYSEYTPMDPDTLTVGGRDLIGELGTRFKTGDHVTLWVSDGPADISEQP